jgi:hypothetical protein
MDVAFPYAQVKAVDWFDVVSVDDCPACGDAGCPECVARYRLRDYPVVVALDMSGLKRLPDYDAVVLAKDSLQTVAKEILASDEDPFRWLETVDAAEFPEVSDVRGAIFANFASCVGDAGLCLQSILERLPEDEWQGALTKIAELRPGWQEFAMEVVGQYRYEEDVPSSRLVSVHYVKPFWPYSILSDDEEELDEALTDAGWDVVSEIDLESLDPKYREVWSRPKPDEAGVEWHGTSWRNLLLAAPELADKLLPPPLPYEAKASSVEST